MEEAAKEIVEKKFDPVKAIEQGLSKGAIIVGEKFNNMEIFLTDLMLAGDAMKAGLDILLPYIPEGKMVQKGKVIIGTVKGDIHSIGKNVVVALLRANGFEVQDIGEDVATSKFADEAEKAHADIIGLSALLTSTLGGQKDVIDYLKETGKRERFMVIIGGGTTTQEWADEIGADGYARTAIDAVKVASELINKRARLCSS